MSESRSKVEHVIRGFLAVYWKVQHQNITAGIVPQEICQPNISTWILFGRNFMWQI